MRKYRSPCVSLSSRIGWFPGSSTRTPTTLSSRTVGLPQLRPEDGRWIGTGGWGTAVRRRAVDSGPDPDQGTPESGAQEIPQVRLEQRSVQLRGEVGQRP